MTAADPITHSRAAEFRSKLQSKIVVADGAMGTMLYAKGIFINRCFDELNLSAPQMVKEIHQEYVKAGAEIIESNTFGGNRVRLTAFGFVEKLKAINQAGVRLAREAAGEKAFVAGAMGPLGAKIEPLGPTSFAEARAVFKEQAEALLGAGIDLIVLETFSDLSELREAIFAAREAAGPDMVIVAQVTVDDEGKMLDGTTTATFHAQIERVAGGCDWRELLSRAESGAGNSGEDAAAYHQAPERDAKCGLTFHRGRAQHLFVLAGIYGAICAALFAKRRTHDWRLLRDDARTH